MKQNTAMRDLIQFCIENAFNIEGQCGTKYIAIDYEEMRKEFDALLQKEEEQIKQAVWYGHDNKPYMIHVPENFASEYFNQTYNNQ